MEVREEVVRALLNESMFTNVTVMRVVKEGDLPCELEYGVGLAVSRCSPETVVIGVAGRSHGCAYILEGTACEVRTEDTEAVQQAIQRAEEKARAFAKCLARGIEWQERFLRGEL